MKRLPIVFVLLVVIFGLGLFVWSAYNKSLVNKDSLYPYINTSEFPFGRVGGYYEAEVMGSLVGAKAKLKITAIQIPDGLNLRDCQQEYHIKSLPKPNTLIRCKLSGYPTSGGIFNSVFEISAADYTNTVAQEFEIIIN